MFYIFTIFLSAVAIVLTNFFFNNSDLINLLYLSVNTIVGILGIIALDGLIALIVRRLLPKKWFLPKRKLFQVSKKEHKFYNKIKVKAWKSKVPELGFFTNFNKSELKNSNEINYLERFIIESNYGIICHLSNAILGFLIMFIPYWIGDGEFLFVFPLSIWLPIFIVNFILSILPLFVLRYTNYTLIKLYNKQLNKQTK